MAGRAGNRIVLAAIRGTLLTTPARARIPLDALAEIRGERGPSAVSRENVQGRDHVQHLGARPRERRGGHPYASVPMPALGIAVIPCGPLSAMALNMLAVPALYLRFSGSKERIARLASSGVAPQGRGQQRHSGRCQAGSALACYAGGSTKGITDLVVTMADKSGFRAGLYPGARGTLEIGSEDAAALVAVMLRRQREKLGLSLSTVARRLGARSKTAYARYEQGRSVSTVRKLFELLAAVAPSEDFVLQEAAHRSHRAA